MNILPDITAKHLTATAQNDAFLLPLTHLLVQGVQLFLTPATEQEAIALLEHVCETWRVEHGEKGGSTWH